MKSYESGSKLEDEITKRVYQFIREINDIPDGGWDIHVDGIDRTPRQIIAYQLGRMEFLLSSEREEQADKEMVTPAPSFKCNQIGGLYESL